MGLFNLEMKIHILWLFSCSLPWFFNGPWLVPWFPYQWWCSMRITMTFTTCKCDCKWNMLPEEAKNSCKLPRLELLYGICFHIYIYYSNYHLPNCYGGFNSVAVIVGRWSNPLETDDLKLKFPGNWPYLEEMNMCQKKIAK